MNMPKINKILYTTSLGPYSRRVYRHALQMAYNYKAELIMLHIIKPVGPMGEALIREYLPADLVEEVHDSGVRRVMEKMKTRVKELMTEECEVMDLYKDVVVRQLILTGRYDETILGTAEAEGVGVIVMGSENRLGIQSGKVQRVIRGSKVPVFIVPTGRDYPQ